MKKSGNTHDISAMLNREFGRRGSKKRKEAEDKAWEEYNAQVLADARHNSGLTQSELAERIGTDKEHISRLERGIEVPSVSTLYRIAAAMGMTVELRPVIP